MKTYLAYGFAIAFANLLLATLLFFLGFHSDPEKLGVAQAIGTVASIAISVTAIVLGTKARRAEIPPGEPFSYGRALGAGVMITLFAALFTIVTHWLYVAVINPGMTEVILQSQIAKMEESGVPSTQIENAQAMMRRMMHPGIQAAFAFFGTILFGVVISLITSAFLKRSEVSPIPATT